MFERYKAIILLKWSDIIVINIIKLTKDKNKY